MTTSTARKLMTVADFVEWESRDELKYELIDGVPVAMTYPARNHRRIVVSLAHMVFMGSRPPCVAEAEAGIISPTRGHTFYQADLAVACSPQPRDRHEMVDPVLIVEVLSPSTENTDRKVKLVDYRKIPSVREVLLVDSTRVYCELHRRLDGDRWLVELLVDPEASITLESIGADLALADIYAKVDFELDDVDGSNDAALPS
jgi:Uma2 family endonuclease